MCIGRRQCRAVEQVVIRDQPFEYEIVGAGFPVVAVQNVQAPLRMWPHRDDVAALNDAGFALVAYRHLGTTDTMEGVARDVGLLLDHLGLREVALWGYSQGAMTAQELALARPDTVRAAVMVATRCRLSAMDRFRYEIEPEMGESRLGVFGVLLMQYGADALCDDERFERYLSFQRPSRESSGPSEEARSLRVRAQLVGSRYGDPSRADALRQVSVPCMVVAFRDDGNIPPALNKEVADAIPGCRYVEIDGAGHAGGLTHRRQVRDHVLPFLTTVVNPPRP